MFHLSVCFSDWYSSRKSIHSLSQNERASQYSFDADNNALHGFSKCAYAFLYFHSFCQIFECIRCKMPVLQVSFLLIFLNLFNIYRTGNYFLSFRNNFFFFYCKYYSYSLIYSFSCFLCIFLYFRKIMKDFLPPLIFDMRYPKNALHESCRWEVFLLSDWYLIKK